MFIVEDYLLLAEVRPGYAAPWTAFHISIQFPIYVNHRSGVCYCVMQLLWYDICLMALNGH